jgi:radical SAM protein with 4Fe4S-binding SPASM domain
MKYNDTHVSRKITEPLSISCKAIEKNSIYIAANGEVYPCCFLGHSPRTYKGGPQGIDQIKKLLEDNDIQNNAKDHSLEDCVNWFNLIEDTWSKSSIADGNMLICSNSCGKCN